MIGKKPKSSKLKIKAPGNQVAFAPSEGYGDGGYDRRAKPWKGDRRQGSGPYFQIGGPDQGGRRETGAPRDRRVNL